MATTETKTWPTVDEMFAAVSALSAGEEAIELLTTTYTRRLINANYTPSLVEGAMPPTYGDVGVLLAFIEHVDLEVRVLEDAVTKLRKAAECAAFAVGEADLFERVPADA